MLRLIVNVACSQPEALHHYLWDVAFSVMVLFLCCLSVPLGAFLLKREERKLSNKFGIPAEFNVKF